MQSYYQSISILIDRSVSPPKKPLQYPSSYSARGTSARGAIEVTMLDFSTFFVALGARVRDLRKKRGLSQEDMISLGFSARHWQQIEAGRPITVTTLLKVCHVLNVPLSEMLADFDELLPKHRGDYR